MIKVYLVNVAPLSDDGVFNAALERVSLKRRKKTLEFKNREDKNLCLGAGLVSCYALKKFFGSDSLWEIEYEQSGKPIVLESKNTHISISHSGKIALCAVSDKPIGADVQVVGEFKKDICNKYFLKKESDYVFLKDNTYEIKKRFARVWAHKEAYIKMCGKSILNIKDFELDFTQKVTATDKLGKLPIHFYEHDMEGYAVAVCTQNNNDILQFEHVNILDLLIN